MNAKPLDPRVRFNMQTRDFQILRLATRHRYLTVLHVQVAFRMGRVCTQDRLRLMASAGFLHRTTVPPARFGYAATKLTTGLFTEAWRPSRPPSIAELAHEELIVFEAIRLATTGHTYLTQREMPDGPERARLLVPTPLVRPGSTHLPDLIVAGDDDRLVGVEIELHRKRRGRLHDILRSYKIASRYAAPRYLVPTESDRTLILDVAADVDMPVEVSLVGELEAWAQARIPDASTQHRPVAPTPETAAA